MDAGTDEQSNPTKHRKVQPTAPSTLGALLPAASGGLPAGTPIHQRSGGGGLREWARPPTPLQTPFPAPPSLLLPSSALLPPSSRPVSPYSAEVVRFPSSHPASVTSASAPEPLPVLAALPATQEAFVASLQSLCNGLQAAGLQPALQPALRDALQRFATVSQQLLMAAPTAFASVEGAASAGTSGGERAGWVKPYTQCVEGDEVRIPLPPFCPHPHPRSPCFANAVSTFSSLDSR